jgi:hypothetical protein
MCFWCCNGWRAYRDREAGGRERTGERGAVRRKRPQVGIVRVWRSPAAVDDPIMSRLPTKYDCLQWYGGEVIRLPDAAEVLATNEPCVVQAFRWGDRAYGFQYHVKPTETTVSDWAGVPAHRSSLESALGANACLQFENLVSAKLPEFAAAARQLNDGFPELISKSASPAGSNGKLPQSCVPRANRESVGLSDDHQPTR